MGGTDNCICKLRNFFQSAISAIRLQSLQSDCNLSNQTAISAIRLQSPQSIIRFYNVVPLGVHIPECVKHPAHRFRLQSQQSDCNLSNQTAISAIRLQSQQSDCNLHNQTAIFAIRLQSQQSDCNLCNQSKTPRNMPETLCRVGALYVSCGTYAISAIGLQSQQSDCNLSNRTAISTIRLQSSQSDCNLSNQTAISAIRVKHLATCLSPCAGLGHHM